MGICHESTPLMGYDMHRADCAERVDCGRGPCYFRLNVWGMSTTRQELARVGVIDECGDPAFPKPSEFGLPDWPEEDATDPASVAFEDAWRKLTDSPREGDVSGIPLYKVCSNDWWLITPGEIITGLAFADRFHEGWRDGLTGYVQEFVEWLESCVPAGGARVG